MATLRIADGLSAGRTIELSARETTLGRHRDCTIQVPAGKVSRQHARILREDDGYYLVDLNSRNGTFVNGERVRERRRLTDRDRIHLADFLFTFHSDEEAVPRGGPSETDDSRAAAPPREPEGEPSPTILRSLDAAVDLRVDVNPAAKLRAIQEVTRHLGSSLDLDELLPRILDSLFRVFTQAERGYLLLLDRPGGRLQPRAIKLHQDESGTAITLRPISRTITSRVMSEGQALLSSDVLADQRFRQSESVLDFEIRSMMAAPLLGRDRRPIGLIYLDTQNPDQQFEEDELDVLVSVATLAAQAVESARLHQALIEERQQAEETLRISERRFRAVWDNSADAMRLTDERGVILAVNQAFCGIVGLTAAELEGRLFTIAYADEEDPPRVLAAYRERFRTHTILPRIERRMAFRSGRRADLVVINSHIELEPGNEVLLSIFRDVTDSRRTAAALRESEERFGALFNEAAIGIAVGSPSGRLVKANPALLHMLGRTEDELVGTSFSELTHPDDPRAGADVYEALLSAPSGEYRTEQHYRTGDGRMMWGRMTISVVRTEEGQPLHLLAMIEDVTERKCLEKDIADLALGEQQRIGQELHDQLGQVLTGLGYMGRSLVEKLDNGSRDEAETARQLVQGLQQALTQVRRIAKGLVPVDVDAEGLRYALQDLAASTQEACGIRCVFECEESVRVEEASAAVHLYHIAQEAVTNAVRHAGARTIRVGLSRDNGCLQLSVQDDGTGLRERGVPAGIGQRIMRYRAGVIGAKFSIDSLPEGGTLVRCTLNDPAR